MNTYAIGDLQGCAEALQRLLDKIEAQAPDANFIFVGDLVNRGPSSLTTLRRLRSLGERALCVLGNHDLHLLAVSAGVRPAGRSDTLDAILQAPDRDELLDWLRHQPLARRVQQHLVVHAGVLPQWTTEQTLALAAEVQAVLRSDQWVSFLHSMYGDQPAQWSDALQGIDRLRCIVNALTRVRYCMPDGSMALKIKEGPAHAAHHHLPWFNLPGRKTAGTPIVFGHWSTLGRFESEDVVCLDTGCVWGGQLTALRLAATPAERQWLSVDCRQYQRPG
jgi:bis(5'-nucleosyl)-tetraphosphatase (symmetrical)